MEPGDGVEEAAPDAGSNGEAVAGLASPTGFLTAHHIDNAHVV